MRGVSRAVSRARFRNDDGRKRRLRKAKKKIRDCLPVSNRRKRLGGGLKGGLATIERGAARRREPQPVRVPSTVLDRARRARVGAAAGATAVARLEERRATRGCAGQATPRALAAIMLLTSSAFSASGRACRVAGRDDGKSVARVHERDTRRVLPEATRRGRGGARRSVPPEANACEISPPLSLGSKALF